MGMKVGFIGTGNMGAALIKGLDGAESIEVIHGFDPHAPALDALEQSVGLFTAKDSPESVIKDSDFIVLAVKPQMIATILESSVRHLTAGKTIISIAAGVTMRSLREQSGNICPVVRIMPNTPALIGEGVYAICLDDPDLDDARKEFVTSIFEKVGQVHVLPEKDFDAFTGVVGSGPAYVFYFMDALVEAAVRLGIARGPATEMVEALFVGSAKLAQESDLSLTQLREMVTSPAGTTVEGLFALDSNAVRAAIIDCATASRDRSKELG